MQRLKPHSSPASLATLLLVALFVFSSACSPDCDVATLKLAECLNADETNVTQSELERANCETGESPVYYQCWEEVNIKVCEDAQRICAQYAPEESVENTATE